MRYPAFTRDKAMHVELGNGYALRSAPERDFGINYAIYRNVNPEFEDFLEYGSDLEGLNYCFWVLKDDVKIGGIIIRPNHIEGLFLRPPHENAFEVLGEVMPVLRTWSDRDKPIEAVDVMPFELSLYERLGFQIDRGRRIYVRSTERFEVRWPPEYEAMPPTRDDVSEVADLFHASFRDYPEGWSLGTYDLEYWRARTEKLIPEDMPDLCRQASTLVRDKARSLVVGACLVGLARSITRPENRYAGISMIGVRPEHRRQGLATRMVQKALSVLHGDRPTLKFGVAVGNSAGALYHSLGFLAGPAHYFLLLGPSRGAGCDESHAQTPGGGDAEDRAPHP